MFYKDLDKKLKMKLNGCMNYNLQRADLEKSDKELIAEFLRYGLNQDKETGKCSYLDKSTYKFIDLDQELVEGLLEVFQERLNKKRDKKEKGL